MTADLSWVQETKTVDAADPAKAALEANEGWRLLAVGTGLGGQTTLTFGWPAPERGEPDRPEGRDSGDPWADLAAANERIEALVTAGHALDGLLGLVRHRGLTLQTPEDRQEVDDAITRWRKAVDAL